MRPNSFLGVDTRRIFDSLPVNDRIVFLWGCCAATASECVLRKERDAAAFAISAGDALATVLGLSDEQMLAKYRQRDAEKWR